IGVSPRMYNRCENGVATPHFDTVVKIADILDVSLDTLAGRSDKDDGPSIHNIKLRELYLKVNQLPDKEQQALIILLDSLVARATPGG
ncbi:MAG TPA: helix-turn-helix transcriptional regulator, partial [Cellvibrionaceae bacterium]